MKKSRTRHLWTLWGVTLCRLLLAATLIVSGFVKAVDPQGMALKTNAYFAYWGIQLSDGALLLKVFVVVLSTVEFMLGIYLLLGIRRRLTCITSLLFMVAMTIVSAYVFAFHPVTDCGCFGAAFPLTGGETLLKNVLLLLAATVTLRGRHYVLRLISERNQWITSLYALAYVVLLNLYALHFLPPIDFMPFTVGTDMRTAYYTPTEETSPSLLAFNATTMEGEDRTDSLLNQYGYMFLLTLPEPAQADDGCNDRINDLFDVCHDAHAAFYALVPYTAVRDDVDSWKDRTGAAYPFLQADGDLLKAMVRSNPGLLLLKDGVIVGKWSNNDLPEWDGIHDITATGRALHLSFLRLLLWFVLPLGIIIFADRLWIGRKFYKHHIFRQHLKQHKHEKENCSRQLEDEQDPARRPSSGQGTQC